MKRKFSKRDKIMFIVIYLLLLAGFVTIVLLMDDLTEAEDPLIISAVAEVPEGKKLVPASALCGENDVSEITLQYKIRRERHRLQSGDLDVQYGNVKIGNNIRHIDLINISVEKIIPTQEDVMVVVVVSLDEPQDPTIYQEIVNKKITFDIIFKAMQ